MTFFQLFLQKNIIINKKKRLYKELYIHNFAKNKKYYILKQKYEYIT